MPQILQQINIPHRRIQFYMYLYLVSLFFSFFLCVFMFVFALVFAYLLQPNKVLLSVMCHNNFVVFCLA